MGELVMMFPTLRSFYCTGRHGPDPDGARHAVSADRHSTALSGFTYWFGALVH